MLTRRKRGVVTWVGQGLVNVCQGEREGLLLGLGRVAELLTRRKRGVVLLLGLGRGWCIAVKEKEMGRYLGWAGVVELLSRRKRGVVTWVGQGLLNCCQGEREGLLLGLGRGW